jgi:hypothetical protein
MLLHALENSKLFLNSGSWQVEEVIWDEMIQNFTKIGRLVPKLSC